MAQKLTVGFSPCPNDTFIFDALVHQKIDTEGLEFEVKMADVEALNQQAFRQNTDITKLSFHAYGFLTDSYVLLNSGSALGNSCGPILISKNSEKNGINNTLIAIPGKYTTANFLLSLAFPKAKNKTEMLFSEIEDAVLTEKTGAGLIIHENRFTYRDKGLKKIVDLGEWWEKETKMPIPLGGIAVKRSLPADIREKANRVLKRSVEFALRNPYSSKNFVHDNASEMEHIVIYKHIDLYVNEFTVELGETGKNAIRMMFNKAEKGNIIPKVNKSLFLPETQPS